MAVHIEEMIANVEPQSSLYTFPRDVLRESIVKEC